MTYIKFIEYERYVNLKKLDFIISCLQNELSVDFMGLDIRCGAGISIQLASLGHEVFGFDVSLSGIISAENGKKLSGLWDNLTFFIVSEWYFFCKKVNYSCKLIY